MPLWGASAEDVEEKVTAARKSVSREHEKRYDKLMQQYTQLKDENTRLEGRLRTMTGEMSGSDAELRMTKERNTHNVSEIATLKQQLQDRNHEIANLKSEVCALRSNLDGEKASHSSIKSRTTSTEKQLDGETKKNAELNTKNAVIDQEVKDLRSKNTKLDSELTALKTELRDATSQKAALKVECSALEAEVRGLTSQQRDWETQKHDKDSRITEVKTEKKALETQCAVRQGEVSGLKEKTSSLETTVTEVRRQADDLKVQNASQRAASDAKEKSMVDSHAADRARDDASHREFIAVQGAAHQAGAERVDQQSKRMVDQLIQQQDKERATQENAMAHVKEANAQVMDFMKLMFQQRNAPEIQQRSEPAITSQENTQDD